MAAPHPEPKRTPTAIDVLAKIQKLLAQLNNDDQKRVLHFLNDSNR